MQVVKLLDTIHITNINMNINNTFFDITKLTLDANRVSEGRMPFITLSSRCLYAILKASALS